MVKKFVSCYAWLLMLGCSLQLGNHLPPKKRIRSFGTALNLRRVKVEVLQGTVLCEVIETTIIMDKSLGTLLRFWGVFQFTQVQPLPSPHKQCWTRASRIFFRVSTLYRVGGGRTARKFRKECTVLTGNREMTEKYEYYSTVSGTFV